jgi:hypothetical protein
MSRCWIFNGLLSATLVLSWTGTEATAQGADPYFVPYGAHRGRIHIGPRHARIRWGGGLTQYGAAVLIQGIDTFGKVAPGIIGSGGGGSTADEGGSVSSENAQAHAEACQQQLEKTRELLEGTKAICLSTTPESAAMAPVPAEQPYARIEQIKRSVEEAIPAIAGLQQQAVEKKQAIETFEKVLQRDRKAFEDFSAAVKAAP